MRPGVGGILSDERNDEHELLREIRDLQREHLSEYKRASQRALELQERAVARQEQIGRLYKRVVAVAAIVLALALIAGILAVLGRASSR